MLLVLYNETIINFCPCIVNLSRFLSFRLLKLTADIETSWIVKINIQMQESVSVAGCFHALLHATDEAAGVGEI